MALFRSKETTEKYEEYRRSRPPGDLCALCAKNPLQEFGRWKIIENDFPYDLITGVHHMLVPVRHTKEEGLDNDESVELLDIKNRFLDSKYDFIAEATAKNKSIPSHFHLHLIVAKDEFR